jgi:hypothetical protein
MTAENGNRERRRWRRVCAPILSRPVSYLVGGVARRVNDVSLGGIRCYSDEDCEPGTRLELELLFPEGDSATVLAEVAWAEVLPFATPARFDVGMRFVDARPADLERVARALSEE